MRYLLGDADAWTEDVHPIASELSDEALAVQDEMMGGRANLDVSCEVCPFGVNASSEFLEVEYDQTYPCPFVVIYNLLLPIGYISLLCYHQQGQ